MTRGAANMTAAAFARCSLLFASSAVGKAVGEAGKAAFNPAWGPLMAKISGRGRAQKDRITG